MTTADWKDSLLLRNYAYGSSFNSAMANAEETDTQTAEASSVPAQLEALGLDAYMVLADLRHLSQAKREAALRSLGVVLPRHH